MERHVELDTRRASWSLVTDMGLSRAARSTISHGLFDSIDRSVHMSLLNRIHDPLVQSYGEPTDIKCPRRKP